ncbi:AI-2E family transporter [Candidatus Beckwithbacteria bacterium]|nr:AI-2E family transporter [Candidatus Beckwithbacteria bacterium]
MDKIEISHRTIIFTVFFLIGLWVVYQIRGVLLLFFIAFVLATALNSLVRNLEKIRIPRLIGIVITFLLVIGFIALIVSGLVPVVADQTNVLTKVISKELPNLTLIDVSEKEITSQIESLTRNAGNVFNFFLGAFSNIIDIFLLITITFYIMIERNKLGKYLRILFGDSHGEKQAEELITNIEHRLGGWVRGEIALMIIVGLLTYIGLTLLGIPYALPLALLAGLLELVPNIGPVISAVPSVLLALSYSFPLALGTIVLYIVVQQLENNLIVPIVMKESIGLPPLITLMCLMIGGSLGGVVGAVLAIPAFITLQVVIAYLYKQNRKRPFGL